MPEVKLFSGGHYNPAITLGVFVSGNIPLINTVFYIVSQLLGGFVGSLLAKAAGGAAFETILGGGVTSPPPNGEALTYPAMVKPLFFTTEKLGARIEPTPSD